MEENNLSPTKYTPDLEIKSSIIYESLCENYGIRVVDGVLEFLGLQKIDLAEDKITKKILSALNGEQV